VESSGGSKLHQEWFDSLDAKAAAKVTVAKSRLELGNTSNVKWFDGKREVSKEQETETENREKR
jgi:hypothetical protein